MIPYITVNPIVLVPGIIILEPFGLLLVSGCIVGLLIARSHAKTLGLDLSGFMALGAWTIATALLLSHIEYMLLDAPVNLQKDLWAWSDLGNGISSSGGILGGILGAVFYLKKYKLPILEYCDALVLGLVVGWIFGRLGCSLVHDHPGIRTDFFLAVVFPDGPRHDLGFYEFLVTIGLSFIAFSTSKRKLPPGILTGRICVLYAPIRFMLDFLRIDDKLYFGLTIAQYFSVILLLIGIWLLFSVHRHFAPGSTPAFLPQESVETARKSD